MTDQLDIEIYDYKDSKRIKCIEFRDNLVEIILKKFEAFDLLKLELKPFSRFTIANELNQITSGKLKDILNLNLKNRDTGCFVIGPKNFNKQIDDKFLIKLSTAISHLIGVPNFDSMAGKFYAKFEVKHEDQSDSYLRKAYSNMDLHTDGTYVKEKTDWLIMTKILEKNVKGGESVLLHIDDWEDLDKMSKHPVARQEFTWGSPKSKNIDYKVKHPVFLDSGDGKIEISYIDQFPEPKNLEQGLFLQELSDSLENSKNKIFLKLKPGTMILANNHYWLHGRSKFQVNSKLRRELLRIRGRFQ